MTFQKERDLFSRIKDIYFKMHHNEGTTVTYGLPIHSYSVRVSILTKLYFVRPANIWNDPPPTAPFSPSSPLNTTPPSSPPRKKDVEHSWEILRAK